MGITETTAASLRQLVQQYPKALVMFTADNCASCEQLRPIYELFATNKAYAGIKLLRLYANGSPVAKHATPPLPAPFFSSYDQGQLVHSETLYTEQQLRAVLHALHHH